VVWETASASNQSFRLPVAYSSISITAYNNRATNGNRIYDHFHDLNISSTPVI